MLKTLLSFVLALALCSPAFAKDGDVTVDAARFVTYFTLNVYHASTTETWVQPVTLAEVYASEAECRHVLIALRLVVTALEAKGVELVDGTACQIVGTLDDEK